MTAFPPGPAGNSAGVRRAKKAGPVSPLGMGIYLLRIPGKRPAPDSIAKLIGSKYPGDLSKARVSVKILSRERDGPGKYFLRALVFAAESGKCPWLERKEETAVPGTAFLAAANGTLFPGKESRSLFIIVSGEFLEAALFSGGRMEDHLAIGRKTAGNPVELLDLFRAGNRAAEAGARGTENGEPLKTVLLLDGAGENDDCVQMLLRHFPDCLSVPLGDFAEKINTGKERIFSGPRGGLSGKTVFLAAFSILLVPSLLLLHSARKMESGVSVPGETGSGPENIPETENILFAPAMPEDGTEYRGIYGTIAEICGALKHCRIRSLGIREGRFDLEAEGDDPLGARAALLASPFFADIALHQARSAAGGVKVFLLSGRMRQAAPVPRQETEREAPGKEEAAGRCAALVQALIKKYGLRTETFRIPNDGTAEFTLRGNMLNVLGFLEETGKAPAETASLQIRMIPGSGIPQEAETVLRFGPGEAGTEENINADNREMARVFHRGEERAGERNLPVRERQPEPESAAGNAGAAGGGLVFLGTTFDTAGNGCDWYKEKESGLLVKILREAAEE